MILNKIDAIRDELKNTLFLDVEDFRLAIEDDEVLSSFIGLQLRSAFQPIYDANQLKTSIGYEALLRPSNGLSALTPNIAFGLSDLEGKLVKFDRVARTLHMLNYLRLPENKGLLFLNVHPKLLTSINTHGRIFEYVLHRHSVPTRQVVIEIIENDVETNGKLQEAVNNYRDRGYQIAIDDFGNRFSNLDRIWKLAPDYVKLDIGIIREAQVNSKIRKILPNLLEMIHNLGAKSIIEGIESPTQLKIAQDAGGNFFQGYYLGKPASASTWRKQHREEATNVNFFQPDVPFYLDNISIPLANM